MYTLLLVFFSSAYRDVEYQNACTAVAEMGIHLILLTDIHPLRCLVDNVN